MKKFATVIAILATYIFVCGLFYLFGAFYSISFDPVKWSEKCRFFVIFMWFTVTILTGIICAYHLDEE